MVKITKLKEDLFYCFLLGFIVIAFLNKGAFMQGVFFGADEIASDLVHFSYPYREFWAQDYLKKGQISLWNPYLGSGLPILAEAQTGIFYPVSIFLYYFFSPPVAFNWLIISSYLLAAIGTYFYCRTLGLKIFSAFFSAAVFTLSGFMVARLRHVPIITAVAFMPFMFLSLEKILTRRSIKWTILLSIFTAFSFFAGHYSTTFAVLFIMLVYSLFRLGKIYQEDKKESMVPVFLVIVAFGLGILLAAIQLVPSAELVQLSTRFNLSSDIEKQGVWRYLPKHLLFFINPYILGDPSRGTWNMQKDNYWENMGYLGMVPLILLLLVLLRKTGKSFSSSYALKGCLILSFILTLGTLTPVYKLFMEWIPGFSFTRISGRFLLFVDFFGAILAGISLQLIAEKISTKKNLFIFSIIALSLGDLFYFGYPFNTVMPLSYLEKTESVKFLEADSDLYRITSPDLETWEQAWKKAKGWRGDLTPYINQRELLPPDYNLLFRLASPSLIYELFGHFSVKRSGELDSYVSDYFFNQESKQNLSKMLGMENVKYVLRSKETDIPGLELVKKIENSYIYRNQDFLPRAYFVGRTQNFNNSNDLVLAMSNNDFDPSSEVLLENSDANFSQSEGRGTVNIEKYEDREVVINADIQDEGYLVLSDTWYPGWKAYVDGIETKIYQANYAYRAIKLDSGNHLVVFEYIPKSYQIGKNISIASVTVLFLAVIFLIFRKK